MPQKEPVSVVSPFQLVILFLSIYTLAVLAIDAVFELPEETSKVLAWTDFCIAWVFLADVWIRWRKSGFALSFWKWGWIDLLASIPVWPTLRWLRIARVVRIIRLLRAIRGARPIIAAVLRHRFQNALLGVSVLTFVTVSLASIGILAIESDQPDANIRTMEDALWWSWVTVTTVGYGDVYPVTGAGRALAAFVMLWGVGAFGIFTAALASVFVEDSDQRMERLEEKLDRLLTTWRGE